LFLQGPSGAKRGGPGCQQIAGTALDATLRCTITLPQYAEDGTWTVSDVFLADDAANYGELKADALRALGFDIEFHNPCFTDITPPVLLDLQIDTPTTDTRFGPSTVEATIRIADDVAGLENSSASVLGVRSPGGLTLLSGWCQRTAGDDYES